MCNKVWKVTACALAGAVIMAGMNTTVWALPNENALAGVSVELEGTLTNEESSLTGIPNMQTGDTAGTGMADTLFAAAEGSLAAAQVEDYVHIRATASEEGEILGKLYDGCIATILGQEGDWFYVSSGSVTGYIKGEYLVYGVDAREEVAAAKTTTATVETDTLHVKTDPHKDAQIIASLTEGDTVTVVETLDGWEKVVIEGQEGYVAGDCVVVEETFRMAESKEEEEARLAAERAKVREELVDYAQQFIGNPYVWGGTSLTNGADCSGFVLAVFRDFGISLPRTSRDQAASGQEISFEEMQPGDLLFYGGSRINHVAIYIGNGQIVHASNARTDIMISEYDYRTPVKVVSYL